MKQLIIFCSIVFLFSCQNGNIDPKPYIVIKIHEDSTGSDGFKYRTVTVKNSFLDYRKFCGRDSLKMGDTVLIGRNEMGDYIISGENLKTINIKPMAKESN